MRGFHFLCLSGKAVVSSLLLFAGALALEEDSPHPNMGAPVLLLDYAPHVIYADQAIALSLRAVNAGTAPAKGALVLKAYDGGGRSLQEEQKGFEIPGGGFEEIPFFLFAGARHPGEMRIEVYLKTNHEERCCHRLLLPAVGSVPSGMSISEEGFLRDNAGMRLILRVKRRHLVTDRRWAWIKWLWRKLHTERVSPDHMMVLVDRVLTGIKLESRSEAAFRVKTVVVQPRNMPIAKLGMPLLAALVEVAKIVPMHEPGLAIVAIGADDVMLGVGPEDFRMAFELLLQQLRAKGFAHVVLVEPILSPEWQPKGRLHRDQLLDLMRIYKCEILSLSAGKEERLWRVGGDGQIAWALHPSPATLSAIGEELANYIRRWIR